MSNDPKADFKRAGVIGWPIGHSRSPVIHGYWIAEHGIDGAYDRYGVPPEQIESFLERFADHGLVGCNVTLPHKEIAFRACVDVDDVAGKLNSVNTLWLDDGHLFGANTDAHGFLANLDQNAPGWDKSGGTAVVLGAGGAARAIIWALLSRGFSPVMIVNRTIETAQKLAEFFGIETTACPWSELDGLMKTASVLVNTTSLGMTGHPPLQIDLSKTARRCPGDRYRLCAA